MILFVEFYGKTTIVSYLIPNPLHTYILNIQNLYAYFVDKIFKRAHSYAHTWMIQMFLYIIININRQFTHSETVTSIAL